MQSATKVELLLRAKEMAREYLAMDPDSEEDFTQLHDKFYNELREEAAVRSYPPPPPRDDAAQAIAAQLQANNQLLVDQLRAL